MFDWSLELNKYLFSGTQDLIEDSRRNTQLHGEARRQVEVLQKKLAEERHQTSQIMMKFDSAFASFAVEKRDLEGERDRAVVRNHSLRLEVEGRHSDA